MWLLLIYVILMIVGDVADFAVGATVAHYSSDAVSLPVFLACYFFTLWIAWVIALKISEKLRLYN